jgi:hypothetical protein
VIPGIITPISDEAFERCGALAVVQVGNEGALAFGPCNHIAKLIIPSSVISIGEHAFGWCSGTSRCTRSPLD